mmetsp:Transcript_125336/g.267548  ORF Transcript_125336/g.267548 Transcript_125336/m.267548 type:complete len:94 (-) Transcript_125336:137-418(-)
MHFTPTEILEGACIPPCGHGSSAVADTCVHSNNSNGTSCIAQDLEHRTCSKVVPWLIQFARAQQTLALFVVLQFRARAGLGHKLSLDLAWALA